MRYILLYVSNPIHNGGGGGIHAYGQICIVQISRAISGVAVAYMICPFMLHGLCVIQSISPVSGVAVPMWLIFAFIFAAALQYLIKRARHAVKAFRCYLVILCPNVRFCHSFYLLFCFACLARSLTSSKLGISSIKYRSSTFHLPFS